MWEKPPSRRGLRPTNRALLSKKSRITLDTAYCTQGICRWVVKDSSLSSLPTVPLGRSSLLDQSKFHRHLGLCTTDYQYGESQLPVFERAVALDPGDSVWTSISRGDQKYECGAHTIP